MLWLEEYHVSLFSIILLTISLVELTKKFKGTFVASDIYRFSVSRFSMTFSFSSVSSSSI
jgi:hypothetical protein